MLYHARKTFVVGFLRNRIFKSIRILRNRLLSLDDLKYLKTYKLSHGNFLEWFCLVLELEGKGGMNNNPNVNQFAWAVRNLMFQVSVWPSEQGN